MDIEEAEIPKDQRPAVALGQESMGPVTVKNRRLYLVVIVILGLVLILGVIGWLILTGLGTALPEGLGVILGAVAGGLVSLVSDQSKT